MVRFLFQTLHDHIWDRQMIADTLYGQMLAEVRQYLGPEVHHLRSPHSDDGMGRFVWSDS